MNTTEKTDAIPPRQLSDCGQASTENCGHFVQFYESKNELITAVARFFVEGLSGGGKVLMIATAAHRAGIKKALAEAELDPARLEREGRLIVLDAAETLARFMTDGMPDRAAFRGVVGELLAKSAAEEEGGRGVRAFGEMVALLWANGNAAAAIELEKYWNEALAEWNFSLFCAYPLKSFREANGEVFAHICREHTHLMGPDGLKSLAPGDHAADSIKNLRDRTTLLEAEAVEQKRMGDVLRERTHALELLNGVGAALAAERDLEHIVQAVTDAGREISKAAFGAFFYNVKNESGESYTLYTLSGASREAFENFPMPRQRPVFAPALEGRGILRVADITAGEHYDNSMPHDGMAVRSYMAVPVTSRTGEVLGGLFFGDPEPNIFSKESEGLLLTLAAQAGIAIENSNLYVALERELETAREVAELKHRMAAIVESSDDAIASKDLRGIVSSWNAGAERLFGYTEEEMIGHSITVLIPPERLPEEAEILGRISRGERVRHYETIRRHKDGTLINVSLTISPIKDASGKIIGASKIARDISERKRAEDALLRAHAELERRVDERTAELKANSSELQKKNEQLGRMASELILTERRERRRLAGLLHDHLQQLLVAALYQLRFLGRRFKGEEVNPCGRIVELIEEGLKTSRTLTVELSPPILHEGGLVPGLQWLARDMEEKHGLFVQSAFDANAETDREDIRVFVFETARELLFNVVKHAATTTARMALAQEGDGSIVLTVSDSGAGFDPAVMPRAETDISSGFGLLNIRERLALLGGRFEVESRPGAGALFRISLPRPISSETQPHARSPRMA